MIPQQEYLKRHALSLPQVSHTLSTGSLILQMDAVGPGRWIIISVDWNNNSNHPGNYMVKVVSPIHNSYTQSSLFQPVSGYPPVFQVQYEEFDQFFLEFSKSHKKARAAETHSDSILLAWEMFLY